MTHQLNELSARKRVDRKECNPIWCVGQLRYLLRMVFFENIEDLTIQRNRVRSFE